MALCSANVCYGRSMTLEELAMSHELQHTSAVDCSYSCQETLHVAWGDTRSPRLSLLSFILKEKIAQVVLNATSNCNRQARLLGRTRPTHAPVTALLPHPLASHTTSI